MKVFLDINHSERVNSVVFHKKKPWVAAALENGNVQVWDYNQQALIESFLAHDDSTQEKADGQASERLVVHGKPCNCVDFHPKTGLLCSGGDDHKIKIWDLGRKLLSFPAHRDSVRSVQFHPQGTIPWILSASYDRQIFIWDYQKKRCLFGVSHSNAVTKAIFHSNDDGSTLILSTSVDYTLKVWDCTKLQQTTRNRAIKQTDEGTLVDPESVKLKYSRETHLFRGLNSVAVSEESTVVSVGQDPRVRVWDLESDMKKVAIMSGHTNYVSDCCFLEKNYIVSASEDGSLIIWDRETHQPVSEIVNNNKSTGASTRFWSIASHNNGILAAAHENGLLVFEYNSDHDDDENVDEETGNADGMTVNEDWTCRDFVERSKDDARVDPYAKEHSKLQARFIKDSGGTGSDHPIFYLFCCLFLGYPGMIFLYMYNKLWKRRKQRDKKECELQTVHDDHIDIV